VSDGLNCWLKNQPGDISGLSPRDYGAVSPLSLESSRLNRGLRGYGPKGAFEPAWRPVSAIERLSGLFILILTAKAVNNQFSAQKSRLNKPKEEEYLGFSLKYTR
jgi:hypothetical protein